MVFLSSAAIIALIVPGLLVDYSFAELGTTSGAQIIPFQYYGGGYGGGGYGCTDPVTGFYIC